jgi:hypothetical protein
MAELDRPDVPTIDEIFASGDAAGDWVLVLSMAMNDLVTLDGQIHDALDDDDPRAGYFFRLLCGTLRELWRLFTAAGEIKEIRDLLDDLPREAMRAYEEVREPFIRPAPSDAEPEPRSWAEQHLKGVRDQTFHYPQVGSDELRDALSAAAGEEALLRQSGPRPFEFADVVAMQAGFGDIKKLNQLQRLKEIVTKAKEIQRLLVPVTWGALGAHLRRQGIAPERLTRATGTP